MRNSVVLCGVLLALSAVSATAAGLNLRWSSCFGDGGAQNRTVACAGKLGSSILVGSFILPTVGVLQASGVDLVLDFASAGTTMPDWWRITCRVNFITCNPTISPSAVNCFDWANGVAAGGLAGYTVGTLYGPTHARLTAGFGVPAGNNQDIPGGTELFLFNTVISNAKTTGAGACTGCTTPVCIQFTNATVAAGSGTSVVVNGATVPGSNYALWQGGAGTGTVLGSDCPAATPTRNSAWGTIKSLYR